MSVSCIGVAEAHYPKIEGVVLSLVVMLFLSLGVYLVRHPTPMAAARVYWVYLISAGVATGIVLLARAILASK